MPLFKTLLSCTLLLGSSAAWAASFDCAKASSAVEKLICSDEALSSQDSDLANLFRTLRSVESQRDALRQEQQRWLKEVRGRCSDVACLKTTQAERIASLAAQHAAPVSPTRAEAGAFCQTVIDNRLQGLELGLMDLDNDGAFERVQPGSCGTAGGECIEVREADGSLSEPTQVGFEWNDYATYGVRLAVDQGRTYSVHYLEETHATPTHVTYWDTKGEERVACEFSSEITEQVSSGPAVCKQLVIGAADRPPYLALADLPHPLPQERDSTNAQSQARIDVDNDGKPDSVALLGYASGAGRGCDFDYFDSLKDSGDGLANGPLHEALMRLQGVQLAEHHPGPSCQGNQSGWLAIDGQIYFESKYRGDAPRNESSQFHVVRKLTGTKVEDLCQFSFGARTALKPQP